MMLTSVSSSGRRVRAPRWWGAFCDLLPQIYLPGLAPEAWTIDLAQAWVRRIPSKCPFERQLWFKDTLLLYIPPLCPLNPVSKQLYEIRLEAQMYLSRLIP